MYNVKLVVAREKETYQEGGGEIEKTQPHTLITPDFYEDIKFSPFLCTSLLCMMSSQVLKLGETTVAR